MKRFYLAVVWFLPCQLWETKIFTVWELHLNYKGCDIHINKWAQFSTYIWHTYIHLYIHNWTYKYVDPPWPARIVVCVYPILQQFIVVMKMIQWSFNRCLYAMHMFWHGMKQKLSYDTPLPLLNLQGSQHYLRQAVSLINMCWWSLPSHQRITIFKRWLFWIRGLKYSTK